MSFSPMNHPYKNRTSDNSKHRYILVQEPMPNSADYKSLEEADKENADVNAKLFGGVCAGYGYMSIHYKEGLP